MHILVVEDEERLANLIKRALEKERHVVEVASNGEDGFDLAASGTFDAVILDVMLPKKNGLDVCRNLRQMEVSTPILMLTAKDSVSDRVAGLDCGADDYLTKPFAIEELLARLRALFRRQPQFQEVDKLEVADLVLDTVRGEVYRAGKPIDLTPKEFALLEYLMRHPNQVLSRERIIENVWGYDSDASLNVVDIYVHFLRRKVDKGFPTQLIRSVRGMGYKIQGQG